MLNQSINDKEISDFNMQFVYFLYQMYSKLFYNITYSKQYTIKIV